MGRNVPLAADADLPRQACLHVVKPAGPRAPAGHHDSLAGRVVVAHDLDDSLALLPGPTPGRLEEQEPATEEEPEARVVEVDWHPQ